MWIILLDHSGSMGGGFDSDAGQATFRDRRSGHTVKLDAAVQCILTDLSRLPADMPVSLFGFTGTATLLHHGTAADDAGFTGALRRLRPHNGTDIAAALNQVRKYSTTLVPRPRVISVLLVSDGLSDVDAAIRAAELCAASALTVDVVLIDPTEPARALATAIAGRTGGRWEPVFGPDELARSTAVASAHVAAQVQQVNRAVELERSEVEAIEAANAGREPVLFAVSHPATIGPADRHHLFVHAYREGIQTRLEERLAELAAELGPRPRRAAVPADSRIPRGTELEIRPIIPNIRCRPPRLAIRWEEELEEAGFELTYAGPADGAEDCTGSVLVSVDGLPIAQLPVTITVSATGGSGTGALRSTSGGMPRDVFGSYSRTDAEMVNRLRAAYRALGVHLFVDVFDIDGGLPWRRYLHERIEQSDLFQLFWSAAAAGSEHVEDEWRKALEVAARRPTDAFFIRPVYWTVPCPAPPPPLAEMNFLYVDPQQVGLAEHKPDGAGPGIRRPRRVDVRFPVLPTGPDVPPERVHRVQDSLSALVPFLEDVTGLRYYPPVTYLVDETTVLGIRRLTEPDAARAEPSEPALDENETVQELRRLLLAFHLRVDRHRYGADRRFEHVRTYAEGTFASNVHRYLNGGQPRALPEPGDPLDRQLRHDFPAYCHAFTDLVLAYVREDLGTTGAHVGDMPADATPRERFTGFDEWYLRELEEVCARTLELVDAAQPGSAFLRTAAPTFGVFRFRGGVGQRQGRPRVLVDASAGQPAVLLCLDAFDRIETDRIEAFLTATLAHEHAHAAFATGLDDDGVAAGVERSPWNAGSKLNEALAAWVQRHFHRGDDAMWGECSRYIATGGYPDWPYAGADALERLFQAEGIAGVRMFIRLLRSAPDFAQRQFDTLAASDR